MKISTFKFILILSFTFLSLTSCRTSGDVVRAKDYVDPTEVKTVDDESLAPATNKKENTSHEELKRQIAVLQGENETLKTLHHKEVEILGQRILSLEEENKKLKEFHGPGQDNDDGKPKNAADQWLLANKLSDKQNYEKSAVAYDDLIRDYSKSPWVFHSYLGKAMSLYGAGEFKDSALVFNQIIDRFPKKREVALAWFGQGSAFHKMGQKQDSKLFFSEIVSRFPKTEEASLAKKIIDKKRQPPGDLFVAFPGWAKYAPQPQE